MTHKYTGFNPEVKDVIEQFCNHSQLSTSDYPYVSSEGANAAQSQSSHSGNSKNLSVRKHTSTASSSHNSSGGRFGSKTEKNKRRKQTAGRIIVFIAGGATFSELRCLYEIMDKCDREVVIGTTHLLTPKDYIHSLRHLNSEAVEDYYTEAAAMELNRWSVKLSDANEFEDNGEGITGSRRSESQQPVRIADQKKKKKSAVWFSCGACGKASDVIE